jgi:hypothetical protein
MPAWRGRWLTLGLRPGSPRCCPRDVKWADAVGLAEWPTADAGHPPVARGVVCASANISPLPGWRGTNAHACDDYSPQRPGLLLAVNGSLA